MKTPEQDHEYIARMLRVSRQVSSPKGDFHKVSVGTFEATTHVHVSRFRMLFCVFQVRWFEGESDDSGHHQDFCT